MQESKKPRKAQTAAVALKYNSQKDYTPIVVASGHGKVAEKIISLADENGVPIFRDDSAAAMLTMLNVGQGIPPELYQVIAAIYIQVAELAKSDNTSSTSSE
ncbi:MAG: EscU/YscU/HrcU family type III secretion system export apparatus switch protein [Oscillospiraceae bacterium]|nr:EscU/YscU/HrcU family type III secretion system export apparatus switch protein [Oscillospiraceae bacterium]